MLMIHVRYVLSSLILMISICSVFAQNNNIKQNIQQLYTQLPESAQKSVNVFASRKYSQKNPDHAETVTNLTQLLSMVDRLSPQMQEQVLRYAQKRHAAIIANKGGTAVYEEIEEGKKGAKKKIPDPYYPDPF